MIKLRNSSHDFELQCIIQRYQRKYHQRDRKKMFSSQIDDFGFFRYRKIRGLVYETDIISSVIIVVF